MASGVHVVEIRAPDQELAFRWQGGADDPDEAVSMAQEDWPLAFAAVCLAMGRPGASPPEELSAISLTWPSDSQAGRAAMPPIWEIGRASAHLTIDRANGPASEPLGSETSDALARALMATDASLFHDGASETWLYAMSLREKSDLILPPVIGSCHDGGAGACSRETARALLAVATLALTQRRAEPRKLVNFIASATYRPNDSATIEALARPAFVAQSEKGLEMAADLIAAMGDERLAASLRRRRAGIPGA